jgi:hypothetical protein
MLSEGNEMYESKSAQKNLQVNIFLGLSSTGVEQVGNVLFSPIILV